MKYIAVQFFGEWNKQYIYKCNRNNISIGDFVTVPTPRGNTVAKVMNTNLKTPSFECKEVIRKVRL